MRRVATIGVVLVALMVGTVFHGVLVSAVTWDPSTPFAISTGTNAKDDYPPAVAAESAAVETGGVVASAVLVTWSAKVSPSGDYDIYISRNMQAGAVGNWEGACLVEDTPGDSVQPDVATWLEPSPTWPDPLVPAVTWVYVAWADDTNRPAGYYDIRWVRTSIVSWTSGCPTWQSITPPLGGSEIDKYPHLSTGPGYAHLAFVEDSAQGFQVAYSRWDGSTVTNPQVLSNAANGVDRVDLAVSTMPDDSIVNVVWDCDTGGGIFEVVSTRSTDGGVTWPPVRTCDNPISGEPTKKSLYPSVAAFEDHIHVTWTEEWTIGLDLYRRIWYARSLDGGATWQSPSQISDDAANYWQSSVTTCGFCVGIAYVKLTTAPPSKVYLNIVFQRSENDGLTWGAMQTLTTSSRARWPSIASDRRVHIIQDGLAGVHHVVYAEFPPSQGDSVVYYRKDLSTESSGPANPFVGARFATSAGYGGTGNEARMVGGWIDNGGGTWVATSVILTFNTVSGGVYGGGGMPEALAETSTGWGTPSTLGFFIFGGRFNFLYNQFEGYRASDRIMRFVSVNEVDYMLAHLPSARFATATASDQNRYSYIFGGIDNGGGYLPDIVRYDMDFDQVCTYDLQLSPARAYASAVWDPASGVAYVFGGRTASGGTMDILRFVPGTGTCVNGRIAGGSLTSWGSLLVAGDEVPTGQFCTGPYVVSRWGTSAAWDPVGSAAYVFGGASCPVIGGDGFYWETILVFHPGATPLQSTTVVACLPMPSPRAYVAAIWDSAHNQGFAFPGRGTNVWSLDQVVWYHP